MTEQQAENLGFKATSVASLIFAVVMGVSGVIAMHNSGIKEANEYTDRKVNDSEKYMNLRITPVERDVEELKKKMNEIPYR